jgi:hypothetical protein
MARIIEGRLAYAEDLTRIFRQVVGAVLLSWQRFLRAGLITAAIVWLLTEIVACFVTSSFPPPAVTHLVAVALAGAVGYGVALTLILGMLLHGGVRLIHQLDGEIEVGARVASVFVKREAGSLGATLRRFAESSGRKVNPATMATLRRTSANFAWPGGIYFGDCCGGWAGRCPRYHTPNAFPVGADDRTAIQCTSRYPPRPGRCDYPHARARASLAAGACRAPAADRMGV